MARNLAWIHYQETTDQWNIALDRSIATSVKFIDDHQAYNDALAANPNIVFVGRHYYPHTDPLFQLAMQGLSLKAMSIFAATWYDSAVRTKLPFFESLNEEYDSGSQDKTKLILKLDAAFVDVLQMAYSAHLNKSIPANTFAPEFESVLAALIRDNVQPHRIKPVVLCAAVGNPSKPSEMDNEARSLLLALGKKTAGAGGLFGYHTYWGVYNGVPFWNNQQVTLDVPMRWTLFDNYLVQNGVKVGWFFGEAGPCACDSSGYALNPWDGWRHTSVYGADRNKLFADLEIFNNLIHKTFAYNDVTPAHPNGRVYGYTLFTANRSPDNWTWFRYTTEDQFALADWTVTHPAPTPIPPTTAWPVQLVDISRHQGNINWPTFAYECGKRNIYGMIIRSSLGVSGCDDKFSEYWTSAKAQGAWKLSAYHLFWPQYDGVAQADNFLRVLGDRQLDFYPVLDVEIDLDISPEIISARVLAFSDRIYEKLGYRPIIYTGAWWWNPNTVRGTGCNPTLCHQLHIAHYSTVAQTPILPEDWKTWLFWQYSNQGIFSGVPDNYVDLNRFNGSLEDWEQFLGDFVPDNPICNGLPREQYPRTYWYVPDVLSDDSRQEIYGMAATGKVTCGPSADDAGIGDLESKTAVLWEIPDDQHQVFIDWFEKYYPGTTVEFRSLDD